MTIKYHGYFIVLFSGVRFKIRRVGSREYLPTVAFSLDDAKGIVDDMRGAF